MTLAKLHDVLQDAMGWTNSHLPCFEIAGRRIGMVGVEEDSPELEDERRVRVTSVLPRKGARLAYRYEYGDDWEHVVEVEEVTSPDHRLSYSMCTAGARACRPEDCGGTSGAQPQARVNPETHGGLGCLTKDCNGGADRMKTNLVVPALALLAACAQVPRVGEDFSSVGELPPAGLLKRQVIFDHHCPAQGIRVLRVNDMATTVDLDVCGKVRRYKESPDENAWEDVTNMFPPESLPPIIAK